MEEITRQVDELLKNKIIKPSQSPYNTPVWIVPKKPDSQRKRRMVLDFRKLNEKTIGDSYPLPNINDIFDSLGSGIVYCDPRASNILAVGCILFFLISSRKYAQNQGEAKVFAGRGGH